jgi:hypothetical protein
MISLLWKFSLVVIEYPLEKRRKGYKIHLIAILSEIKKRKE